MSYTAATDHLDWSWPDPSVSGDAPGAALPVYVTSLVGRDADRERLHELLIDERHRMVVITGGGGIGKTRLAVEVATDLARQFQDGSRFVSFAAIPRNSDLDGAFAWSLGLRDTQAQSYRESIRQQLQGREQLLVLDNIEHLPEIADLLVFVQNTCPGVSLLVTSRRELQVYGEVIHHLSPLPVRQRANVLPGIHPAEAMESPAVHLVLERARAVAPNLSPSPAEMVAIAEICNLLGGIPLALELIAPRLGATSPTTLLNELRSIMDRPPGASREPLDTTISIQETMRISYDRLEPSEQQGFRVLSIMHGQWTIDDVLPMLTTERSETDAIALIEALVTRSIIATPSGPSDDVRFTINPVLQHFGRALLVAANEHREVVDQHANRMIELAEQAEPEFTGRGQQEWLARIDALYNDMRHAYVHLRDTGRAVDALRLMTSLWRYAYVRGHYREVRRWIEQALRSVNGHDALRARAYNGVGFLANMTGDDRGTRTAHERALPLAERLHLHRESAIAHIGLADVAAGAGGDPDLALRHLEYAIRSYEQLGEPRGIGSVLTNQGNIQWMQGNLDLAFATHEQARRLYEEASDLRGMAWSDTNTGRIATLLGRHHEAVPRLRAAFEGYLTIGDGFGVAEILEALTKVAVALGDRERASVLAGAATTMREATGAPLRSPDLEEFQSAIRMLRRWPSFREAFERGRRLSPDSAVQLARSMPVPSEDELPGPQQLAHLRFGITPREHEVLVLAGEGMTDQQIAERLDLSRRTVQTYISAILRKLKVTSRVSAVRTAHQAGILPKTRDTEPS